MANEQNLVDIASRPEREQLAMRQKAAAVTNQKKKQKKLMREDALEFLAMPIEAGQLDDIEYLQDVKGKNITVQQAILLAMIKKAMKGDRGAAEYVRDTAGQMITNVNVTTGSDDKFSDIVKQLASGKGSEA